MKYLLIIIIFILISSQLSAHREFFQVLDENGTLSIAYYTTDKWTSQILSWSKFDMASIQIYPMLAATIPSTLDATTTLNQFKDAAKTWRDANCNTVGFNFLTQVTSSSLSIQFMSVDSYFHDPANDGGVTHLQVDPDYRQIVYSTENSLWDATTDIMFNSSDSFNFYWSNSLNSGNYGNLDICFEAVALHEIGHLIGFDHCTVNTAIMYNQILSGPTSIRTSLNSNDITEIHIMADCEPPGIPSPNILQVESKIDFINPNDKK